MPAGNTRRCPARFRPMPARNTRRCPIQLRPMQHAVSNTFAQVQAMRTRNTPASRRRFRLTPTPVLQLKSSVVYSATPQSPAAVECSGNVTNGSFVLSATGVLSYASSALTAANYNAFRSLVSNGSCRVVHPAQSDRPDEYGQAALSVDYQNFQALTLSDNARCRATARWFSRPPASRLSPAATASLNHAASRRGSAGLCQRAISGLCSDYPRQRQYAVQG